MVYSFREMSIIGQNLKYTCVTFFSWTSDLFLINLSRLIFVSSLISHYIKEILCVNTYYEWGNENKGIYIYTCVRFFFGKNPVFLYKVKNTLTTIFHCSQFHHTLPFHGFMNTFFIRSKKLFQCAFTEVWTSTDL